MAIKCLIRYCSRSLTPFVCLVLLGLGTGSAVAATPSEANIGLDTQCKVLKATGNPEYPPFLWVKEDGVSLDGAVVKLLDKLSEKINVTIEPVYVGPWSRSQQEVRAGRVDLMAGAFYTSSRADYMSYFSPAMMFTKSSVWQANDARFPYSKWEDLVGRWGVTVINNSFGQSFDAYAKQKLNLLSVASVEQAFSMLDAGRADYVLYERSPGLAYIDNLEMTDQVVSVEPAISSEGLFLALSKNSACNTEALKQRINDALKEMVAEGVPKEALIGALSEWTASR